MWPVKNACIIDLLCLTLALFASSNTTWGDSIVCGDRKIRFGTLGKVAKIELFRRLVPLFLVVLGLVGLVSFMSPFTALVCLATAIGVYAAAPQPRQPAGVIQPEASPPVWMTDLVGYTVGIPLFTMAFIGLTFGDRMIGAWTGLLAFPACFCLPIFLIAVRQKTSWVRFFGNGFEFAEMGLKTRVRYVDLENAMVREWQTGNAFVRALGSLGFMSRQKVALLSGSDHSRTLVFTRKDGTQFAVSSEVIPDLQRILIGMDRAGVELPHGFGEREREKIRKKRERLYRKADVQEEVLSPREQAKKIAALLDQSKFSHLKGESS